jgi:hypothetical protein
LLFGHNATALLPHRASYRRNIRLRIGQRAYSDRLLDERGALVGALEATVFVDAPSQMAGFPLAAITAGDLASPGPFVDTAMTRTEVIEEVNASGQVRLPLVERGSHRLVGIVNRNVTPSSVVVPR